MPFQPLNLRALSLGPLSRSRKKKLTLRKLLVASKIWMVVILRSISKLRTKLKNKHRSKLIMPFRMNPKSLNVYLF